MAFTPPPPDAKFLTGSTASTTPGRKPIGGGGGPSQPGRPTLPPPTTAPPPAAPPPSDLGSPMGAPAPQGSVGGIPIPDINPDDVQKEWYAPNRRYTSPAGGNILAALFGTSAQNPGWLDFSGVGALLPGPDNDPFYQARQALQYIISSGSGNIPGATQQLLGAIGDSTGRYQDMGGMPSFMEMFNFNGEGDDVYGGYGPIQALLGRAIGQQGTTGWRDRDTGMAIDPTKSDIFRSFIQSTLAGGQNPHLDPMQNLLFQRGGEASSPYARPNIDNQMSRSAQIEGSIPTDLADSYIQQMMSGADPDMLGIATRLVDDTGELTNDSQRQLMRNIDVESQRTLAEQLPEVQAAMQASGMGRSGAAGMATANMFSDVMGQANRDKQALMGQFAESALARNAAAISQAAGLRGQGELQGAQQVGQSILGAQGLSTQAAEGMKQRLQAMLGQGFGQQFQSNEASRDADRSLMQQAIGRQAELYQGDQGRLTQMLLGTEGLRQQGLASEAGMQQNALSQMMQMFGLGEGTYESSLQRMLGLAEQQRVIQSQQQAGTLEAMMLPLQIMMQLSTGISSPVYSSKEQANPWAALGPQLAGSALGSIIQGGAPSMIPDWLSNSGASVG